MVDVGEATYALPSSQSRFFSFYILQMKTFKVFGRITASKDNCHSIITDFFQSENCLACFEHADDGCSRDHCHFIAQAEYKNMKSLRQSLSDKCFKVLGERLQYSIKEYDEEKDGEAYICKGHKTDASVTPDIFINTYDIDVEECYNRFHKTQADIKASKKTCCVWKELITYIEKHDRELFDMEFHRVKTPYRIASHLFDWYIEKGRMIQGKYIQQCIIRTIIANKFQSKKLKKQIISEWYEDFTYYASGEVHTAQEIEFLEDIL